MANQENIKGYWQDTVTTCVLVITGLIALIFILVKYQNSQHASNFSRSTSSPSQSQINPPRQESTNQQTSATPSSAVSLAQEQASPLTQAQAVELVTQWLAAKPKIFGPPFDKNLLGRLTTGNTYQDNLGSIDWLQGNGYRYRYSYSVSRIDNVWSFVTSNASPFIKVSVYEDLTLYSPKGIDRSKSGASKRNFIYYFTKDVDGQWKISDYRRAE